jgi:hypothetical protein
MVDSYGMMYMVPSDILMDDRMSEGRDAED